MANSNRTQLELRFKPQFDPEKEIIITVLDPKDSLTKAEADSAANVIIAKNVFTSKYGDLAEYLGAQIRVLSVTALA